jgi:hypothetical protein
VCLCVSVCVWKWARSCPRCKFRDRLSACQGEAGRRRECEEGRGAEGESIAWGEWEVGERGLWRDEDRERGREGGREGGRER